MVTPAWTMPGCTGAEVADASTPVQPGMVQAGVTIRVTYEMTR